MKKLFFVSLLFILALNSFAQDEEPIITFHTTLYDDDGSTNTFSLALGARSEGQSVDIDCGYGRETVEVNPAYIEGDSTLTGTYYSGRVSKKGIVKIYGDPSQVDYFNASGCSITDIQFRSDLKLTILNLEYNSLTSLNIDDLQALQVVYLTDNPFTKETPLNIGYLPNLVVLDIHQVGYISPDFKLSNFPLLTSFDAYHCLTLTNADTSENPYLVRLSLDMASVDKVDVTKNPYLSILNISDTKVTSVDLTQCPKLSEFYCARASGTLNKGYKLSTLDVTHNPELYVLFCEGNDLTSLDLSQNPLLFDLSAPNNLLTSIDLSNNPDLYNVNLRNNNLDFVTLPLPQTTWSEYYYSQRDFVLNDTYKVGDVIDLSSRVLRDGTTTTAKMYSVPKDNPTVSEELDDTYYSYENGKVTLLKPCDEKVYVAFSNSAFSAYDLYTEKFNVKSVEDFGKDVDALSFSSNTTEGSEVSMGIGIVDANEENPVNVSVDFGDGNLQTYSVTTDVPATNNIKGTRAGNGKINVYVPQDRYLSAITTDGLNMTSLDLSELTDLRVLKLRNAGLTSIDLSYNSSLETLDLSNNNLTSLALEGPSYFFYKGKLADINLSNNQLSTLTFDDLYAVQTLNLSNNLLTEVDFSDADNLRDFNVSNNKFTQMFLTNSDSIRMVDIANNAVDTLYIPTDAPLSYCNISGNNFTLGDMPTLSARYSSLGDGFIYAPLNVYTIAETSPGVDLSSQFVNVNGATTQYAWKKMDGTQLVKDVDYTIENGSTKFLNTDVGQVYCEMTHEAFPQFAGENTYRTTLTTPIIMPTFVLGSFTTLNDDDVVELSLASPVDGTSVYFDWNGDGNVTQYTLKTTYTQFSASTKAGANVRILVADKKDKLSILSITGAKMKDVNLNNLSDLYALTLADAGLTSFTMATNKSMAELNLSGNELNSIDLSMCPNLYYLSVNGNNLTTIDLSKASGLGLAYVGNNKLSSITLKNSQLWNLDLGMNDFTDVNLDGAPNIEQLWLNNNNLTSVNLDNLESLRVLNLVGNKFLFSTLPVQKSNWAVYSYGNQTNIDAHANGFVVDLSSEYAVGDSLTTYRWFVGQPTINEDTEELEGEELVEGEQFTIENGVTTFCLSSASDNIVGVLTNEQFPNLTLYTNPISIAANGISEVRANDLYGDVYTTDGRLVGRHMNSTKSLTPGMYIITSGGQSRKIIVR